MQNAIVTVKLSGRQQEYDLEVPTEVPSQQLAELILHNLSSGKSIVEPYIVRCLKPESLKRTLRSEESLAAAELWDGTFLEIEPAGAFARKKWKDIVERWEPLQLGDARIKLVSDREASPKEPITIELSPVDKTEDGEIDELAGAQDAPSLSSSADTITPVTDFEPIKLDDQASTGNSENKSPDPDRVEVKGRSEPPRTSDHPWKDIG